MKVMAIVTTKGGNETRIEKTRTQQIIYAVRFPYICEA